jgi:hypothetical protein
MRGAFALETPVPRAADLPTPEERRDALEPACRAARFKYAEERIRKIVDGAPELTDEQLRKLAVLLSPPPR